MGTRPDAGADLELLVFPGEDELGNGLVEDAGDACRLLHGTVLDENSELVSPQPRDRVALPDAEGEGLRQSFQQGVSGHVSAGVVHHLELVQIQVAQSMGAAIPAGRFQESFQAALELQCDSPVR